MSGSAKLFHVRVCSRATASIDGVALVGWRPAVWVVDVSLGLIDGMQNGKIRRRKGRGMVVKIGRVGEDIKLRWNRRMKVGHLGGHIALVITVIIRRIETGIRLGGGVENCVVERGTVLPTIVDGCRHIVSKQQRERELERERWGRTRTCGKGGR